jgi:hypothetical protein
MRGWRFGSSRMPEHSTSPCKMPRHHRYCKASVSTNSPASRMGASLKSDTPTCVGGVLHSLNAASPMSRSGHLLPKWAVRATSAYPPKSGAITDIVALRVCAPIRDSRTAARNVLFDHLIRNTQHVWGNGEAERLGCFEVDHQFEFRWLLDRQVCGTDTFQDFIDVCRGAPEQV